MYYDFIDMHCVIHSNLEFGSLHEQTAFLTKLIYLWIPEQ